MIRRTLSTARLLAGATALTAALATTAGCGSDPAPVGAAPSGPASGTSIACNGSGQLLGAGSTAQANAVDIWKVAFGTACPDITVTYGGGGSGAGVQQFNQGKVTFAGSDAPLKPEEVTASKQVCTGGQGIDLPMVAGLISIVYDVDGVDGLVLDAPTVAKVFDGQITKWNDPAIAALNPGAALPNATIQSFHRGDDSGTTANLTAYLAAAGHGAWPYPPGKTWAGRGGQSANGSAGVSAQVKQVQNSIGYVELSYAETNGLRSAAISTGAPQPVAATAANAATTFAGATVAGTGSDLALDLDYATTAPGAYPIVLVTYEIVCDKGNRAGTLDALKSFLTYTISAPAQQAIGAKGYVPLPQEVASKVQAVIPTLS
ncbi:phosphate ABC transporter substrate-binding protein PstS [Streptomyces sp. NRRL B-24484]|uniref:phosphate ABC transporter substrate-binding protein PstS n=1 Tax=Streptomyces sp. NRRL B-24484 TaxID=1463833 RepID=UPI0004BF4530|nr:phosphate ABC transporter substrate-binding protein PstS [Streptomyces sp. NRRL B-24484]